MSQEKKRKLQINPGPLRIVKHRVGEKPPPPPVTRKDIEEVEQAARDRAARRTYP